MTLFKMVRDFSLLFMWIALVCSDDVATNSSTNNLNGHVLISSNVDTVYTGLTRSLTINCSVSGPKPGGYGNLVSLVISKRNNVTNQLEEIVLINSFASNVINILQPTTAKASALFDDRGPSFLKLDWKYPETSDTGFYQCECTTLDAFGHPNTLTAGQDIKHAEPTFMALVNQFAVIGKQLDKLENLRDRVSLATGSMFVSTNATNGWRYHISKFAYDDVDKAEAACNLVNGHLVDFENKAEYDLVNGYIKSEVPSSPSGSWLIGLSDEATEGKWLVRYSGQPAVFVNWYGGSAQSEYGGNRQSEDCSSFKTSGNMYTRPCTSTDDTPFICKSRDL